MNGWDGVWSELASGAVAAGVAFLVVRLQAHADDVRARRAHDVETAVGIQRASIAYSFAVGAALTRGEPAREALQDAMLGVWVAVSRARASRPRDDNARAWMEKFQDEMTHESDAYWQNRTPQTTKLHIVWMNSRCNAIARYLEEDQKLPEWV